jgi:hypothetical protein
MEASSDTATGMQSTSLPSSTCGRIGRTDDAARRETDVGHVARMRATGLEARIP